MKLKLASTLFVGTITTFFILATLAFLTGCDKMAPVTKPIVNEVMGGDEPAEPTTNGEVKEPEEESTEELKPEDPVVEPDKPEEEPADTTPPTVIEITWYSDEQLTTVENIVHPGDTVYAVVTFSEAVARKCPTL